MNIIFRLIFVFYSEICNIVVKLFKAYSDLDLGHTMPNIDDDDFCYKCVQTPGMSPPRQGHGPIVSSRHRI